MKSQLFIFLVLLNGLSACNNNGNKDVSNEIFPERIISVEEKELSSPVDYLMVIGEFNSELYENSGRIYGTIVNSANVATFKDIVIEVTFYKKGKVELANLNYTINDFFPPNSKKPFELSIDYFQNVNSVEWKVINAISN